MQGPSPNEKKKYWGPNLITDLSYDLNLKLDLNFSPPPGPVHNFCPPLQQELTSLPISGNSSGDISHTQKGMEPKAPGDISNTQKGMEPAQPDHTGWGSEDPDAAVLGPSTPDPSGWGPLYMTKNLNLK